MSAEIVTFVPEPLAPCKQCVENAVHQDEHFGLVWCGHTRYGGLYNVERGQWTCTGPYGTEQEFRRAMAVSMMRLLQSRAPKQ